MPEQWSIRLYGTACAGCGLPAEGVRVYGEKRRVFHVGGWFCDLPVQPRPVEDEREAGAA